MQRPRYNKLSFRQQKWTWLSVFQTGLQPVISSFSQVGIGTKPAGGRRATGRGLTADEGSKRPVPLFEYQGKRGYRLAE